MDEESFSHEDKSKLMDMTKQLWIIEHLVKGFSIAVYDNQQQLINTETGCQIKISALDFEILKAAEFLDGGTKENGITFYESLPFAEIFIQNKKNK